MDFLDCCYQKDQSVVSRKIADEIILVPIRKNVGDLESIYTLDEIGAKIWELVDGKRKMKEIKNVLLEEFDVTEEQVVSDMKDFIGQLEVMGGIKLIVEK
ncbi:MAG: hypothetical protein A3C43_08425 [Candidatus Schekmanbacteria bacterium RIFCSPHIGHO2_02_FULL_38_11]|uniref:PqqD family protein n=1 Tax=Candidatus Schekmanbacteria bacterium RIFCSPLOWO2_12_FULL_38_15 TaxID=1817883 RepID=A0A1F7SFU2_9BACT|nr:MAG: hypothetical protein A2043_00990 [Candidatus Schekmanbacteria bacterium GWA2_38_9]OGL48965.1 MAG: hypothetical protein A3C43_08425 [Candidatus Schekmanbacteria bacterium RIFCSPHIGHO2_02_FULL_38_11]OGL49118.1 MAG: hypothetical protein A3H37_04070 [Candidatus Schekmanbacteria bacterium RIFCSPLOWO2_02_FULL_38_14]OGL52094.1 MAG: hypothetical protein A3G31_06655 [Candidatus Schekmanbacteria bacterium RIFCSPLOWO2_12_FULL_38_15]